MPGEDVIVGSSVAVQQTFGPGHDFLDATGVKVHEQPAVLSPTPPGITELSELLGSASESPLGNLVVPLGGSRQSPGIARARRD